MESIEWTEIHDNLQLVMKRELETMRQLLDNMNLEEQFILRKEKKYWGSMMEERAHLIDQLSEIRQSKLIITEKLESITQRSNAPLEELLPEAHTNSWEVLSLRDQMVTLLERMNLQTSRNEMLMQLERIPAPQVNKVKKKISIATLPSEDYKEKDE
ncbi:MAG: hypothetical protein KBA81_07130 [Rhabdochlamydiaceae bacterium]|nr:hypothetical protein [Rhabdochlamydiaceae bacterium]